MAYAFLIGFLAGLRTFSAPAVTAWATHLGWLRLERPLALIGTLPSVITLSIFAVIELIGDKWPGAPNRTALGGVIARIATGALSGACVTAGTGGAALPGALLGAVGGVAGCFAGFHARAYLVKSRQQKDWHVALVEDIIAVAGSFWIVSQ